MMTDSSYLGLRLPHPFIIGASPMSYTTDGIKRLEDAGAAAVVLHSLFEEQITPAGNGTSTAFPNPAEYRFGPDAYASHIHQVKRQVRIPIIGSLNGCTGEAWLRFARVIEQAGADAIELNLYDIVTDLDASSAAIEDDLVGIVTELRASLRIPISLKLSPYFTAFGNVAKRLDAAGVDGLVLFNRFYQPDIDIRTSEPAPRAELSGSSELLLRLRWIAILHGRVRPSLAVTGGVATPNDGIKSILAGADAVQLVSSVLRHGPGHIAEMRQGLERWLEWNHMPSVDHMRGTASLASQADPSAFERAHYIRTLHSWTR